MTAVKNISQDKQVVTRTRVQSAAVETPTETIDSSVSQITSKLRNTILTLVIMGGIFLVVVFWFWPQIKESIQYFTARDAHEASVNRSITNIQSKLTDLTFQLEASRKQNQEQELLIKNLTWRADNATYRFEAIENRYEALIQGKTRTVTEVELQTLVGILTKQRLTPSQ